MNNTPKNKDEQTKETGNETTPTAKADKLAYLAFSNATGSTEPPSELDRAALPGIVGEVIGKILPYTEAGEAALLVSLLAGFGNIAGRSSYTFAGQSKHYPNLNVILVGKTGGGRKGTSWNSIKPILRDLDEDWAANCIANGLSSGEGLIHHVRDERAEKRPIKKGQIITGYQDEIVDQGIDDKRLFVIEEEFGSVLKKMGRKENSLSPNIREAWDGGNLRSLVKGSPDKATNPHISIFGHITKIEAVELFTGVDCHNGFANRFLWIYTERSKMLPRGSQIPMSSLAGEILYLKEALAKAKGIDGELPMSDAAWELYESTYPQLTAEKHGVFGAATGRAEAQVRRLCLLYAQIRGESVQSRISMEAALALWKYCEATANWMFGTPFNNPDADRLHKKLLEHPDGLTKTEISLKVFGNHCKNNRVANALVILEQAGAVTAETVKTSGADKMIWLPVNLC